MSFELATVQYNPGQEPVILVCRVVSGIFAGDLKNVETTQTALAARATGGVWSDAECAAEAQAYFVANGVTGAVVVVP